MEFYEVVNRRRSIRQFEDREIPREILERILGAGLKAPSSNHQRRWELLTLTEKPLILDLAKIIKPYPCRITEPKTPQQEMFKIAYPRQRRMIEESACVILPLFQAEVRLRERQKRLWPDGLRCDVGAGGKHAARGDGGGAWLRRPYPRQEGTGADQGISENPRRLVSPHAGHPGLREPGCRSAVAGQSHR